MEANKSSYNQDNAFYFSIIGAVTVVCFWKIFLINDVIWDDNCWLQSVYSTNSRQDFVDTGWAQLRRPLVGSYLYFLFWPYRHTDFFFPIWHSLSLLTQLVSAIFLFLFVRDLFKNTHLALLTALFFLAYHLDQTLPYASATNYRVGLALSTVSLYLTVRACAEKTHWGLLLVAALCALIAHSVFIELALALEPGRLAAIAYCLHRRGEGGFDLIKKTLGHFLPFLALGLPLVAFKFTTKPFGIYQGSYIADPWFFLKWKSISHEILKLIFSDWFSLRKLSRYGDILSFVTLPVTVGFFVHALRNLRTKPFMPVLAKTGSNPLPQNGTSTRPSVTTIIFITGLLFLLPPLLMVKYAGMSFYILGAQDNAHAIFGQIGLAILAGLIATLILSWSAKREDWIKRTCALAIACILGLGVYYNNIVIDLFRDSSQRQVLFWKRFTDRFPTLPNTADFLFDVDDQAPYSDLRGHFDFEINLNLLYLRSTDYSQFRKYRVFVMEEYRNTANARKTAQLDDTPIERNTQWGHETLDPKRFVVVRYRNGELLVNEEIKQHQKNDRGIPYGNWLDHKTPTPLPASDYPLRHKVPGF
jgi:hypothetical protein